MHPSATGDKKNIPPDRPTQIRRALLRKGIRTYTFPVCGLSDGGRRGALAYPSLRKPRAGGVLLPGSEQGELHRERQLLRNFFRINEGKVWREIRYRPLHNNRSFFLTSWRRERGIRKLEALSGSASCGKHVAHDATPATNPMAPCPILPDILIQEYRRRAIFRTGAPRGRIASKFFEDPDYT